MTPDSAFPFIGCQDDYQPMVIQQEGLDLPDASEVIGAGAGAGVMIEVKVRVAGVAVAVAVMVIIVVVVMAAVVVLEIV